MSDSPFTRPSFDEALSTWTELLKSRGWPSDMLWVFDENIGFERPSAADGPLRLTFQTTLTPPPPEAPAIAFEHFGESEVRLVFYRVGSSRGRSICAILCDKWFEDKGEAQGYVRQDQWRLSFRPGGPEEIEEITDPARWSRRLLRDRPLHELDFCMTLTGIREILAHDRVLTPYERYALKFLHLWRRLLGRPQ